MSQPGLTETLRSEAARVSREESPVRKLFGLVELDAAGTVLYTRFETDGMSPNGNAPDYRGQNFYMEVAPFRNVAEFKKHFDQFSRGSQAALSLDFVCEYEDGPLHVRVLLARIRERSETDVTKSVLVHIRRAK